MLINLLDSTGKPAGQIDIPDDVVEAAQKVGTYLLQQLSSSGGLAVICGVTLYHPPSPILEIPKMPLPEEDTGFKLWWSDK